jgi:hypothetical protein
MGVPQSQSGCYAEKKNITPAGNLTLAVQPVAIPTEVHPSLANTLFNIHMGILKTAFQDSRFLIWWSLVLF